MITESELKKEDLTPITTFEEDPGLVVTNRVLRTVYQAVKSGVSLNEMRHFIDVQRINGKSFQIKKYFRT